MVTHSQATQLRDLLNLPGVNVDDMTIVEGVGVFFILSPAAKEAACPWCGELSQHVHQNHFYNIQDLPWNNQDVFLRVNRRQFKCKKCQKPFSEELSFVRKRRLYTQRLADTIVSQVIESDIESVSARTGITADQIGTMLKDVGSDLLEEQPKPFKKLGMDEIAWAKGKGNYCAVLVNLETHKPVAILPSRSQESLREVFDAWGFEVLNEIEEVSIDLWKPYKNLIEEMMPNAEVVADRFHVMKLVNDELDEHRKVEKKAAEKIKDKAERARILKGLNCSKYALLKNEEDLNESQKQKLSEVSEVAPDLAKMHQLKEEFRQIFETSKNWAEGTLRLLDWLVKSANYFKDSCSTIIRWFGEVTAYFECRISNGIVEGINNKLKLIKRSGYGFRNFGNFRLRSLLSWEL